MNFAMSGSNESIGEGEGGLVATWQLDHEYGGKRQEMDHG
ncbi:hypothetical protein NSU_3238 [Novosphingobium pentaromativorans US6-1]|uniref:Uncharacterized protein n=1 Tax=Novosphingobium pentaromativorans US6-1 TaxID=1088721 RepID=G6EFW7_9SPHN|nr:hypothetical protein NSU_3238 [Novosphingobium pentaromativorans US6-1]